MKTINLLLVFILLVGFSFAQDGNLDELYANGVAALENGKWDKAEELLNSALALKADFAPALIQLAHISVRNGDMDKTKDYLRQAIDIEPENQEYRDEYDQLNEINKFMSQGARELDAGEYENSFNSYSQITAKYPYMTEAIYSIGIVKMREGDYDSAVKYFNEALAVNPNHEKSQQSLKSVAGKMFNDGNNYYRRRDYTNALNQYQKVVSIDDSFYQAHYQLGVVQTRLKNLSGAVKSYTDAVEAKPDFYQGWYGLGIAKRSNSDDDGALIAFKKAIELNPSYAKAYCAMGDIYYKKNQIDLAQASCQQAIQVDGTYAKPYITLAAINIDRKEYDMALTNLELATALDRKDSKAWYRMAQVYNVLGNCEEAKVAARKSIDLSNKFGGAWVELGIAEYCVGAGNKTAALNALDNARSDRMWKTYAEHEMDKIRNPHRYENQ